jgi:hypothetical protein
MLNVHIDRTRPGLRDATARPKGSLAALGGVLLWVMFFLASEVVWQHGFGFSTSGAWALAFGLSAYIGLLILAMLILVLALRREH